MRMVIKTKTTIHMPMNLITATKKKEVGTDYELSDCNQIYN